jgi:hypothetical protein
MRDLDSKNLGQFGFVGPSEHPERNALIIQAGFDRYTLAFAWVELPIPKSGFRLQAKIHISHLIS